MSVPSCSTASLCSGGPMYPMNLYEIAGGCGLGGGRAACAACWATCCAVCWAACCAACWAARIAASSSGVGGGGVGTGIAPNWKMFRPVGSMAGRGASSAAQSTGKTLRDARSALDAAPGRREPTGPADGVEAICRQTTAAMATRSAPSMTSFHFSFSAGTPISSSGRPLRLRLRTADLGVGGAEVGRDPDRQAEHRPSLPRAGELHAVDGEQVLRGLDPAQELPQIEIAPDQRDGDLELRQVGPLDRRRAVVDRLRVDLELRRDRDGVQDRPGV